ncbi:MAG: DNA mismatch repair endonuclease MutL [Deltaproteobacteria bacterium]|nr:DNA mismatch repair endonuclease MutL [Deltaproteobacteria bacterium]
MAIKAKNRIKKMDERLSVKIAAGEVVERPASVVKELLENSLDAGSTDVAIEVRDGGKTFIRITDNGSGISREDASLAFERHATSKIYSEDDLFNISTMGFRGEALASIASVARVTLSTRSTDEDSGVSVTVNGGGEPSIKDKGLPSGTSVEVEDIFSNTPARLKFLRSSSTEFGRILETVKRIALSRPDVRIKLVHGKSVSLDVKKGSLKDRVFDIFGASISDALLPVRDIEIKEAGASVAGFVGAPELTFSNANSLYTYVNGRFVRDKGINRAVMDGFMQMLPSGRYPFVVLDIRINPEDVDVNVHPAKIEVRFKNTSFVFDMVRAAVKSVLLSKEASPLQNNISREAAASHVSSAPASFSRTETRLGETVKAWPYAQGSKIAPGTAATRSFVPAVSPAPVQTSFAPATFIGQLFGEFLLFQEEDAFILIDQHAAAERVRYDKLRKSRAAGERPPSQYLLIPERVETTPEEKDSIVKSLPELMKMGFEIEPFGPSHSLGGETFLIKAVPEILGSRDNKALIKDLASDIAEFGSASRVSEAVDSALMRVACHSVVRGPRQLRPDEAAMLFRDIMDVETAGRCPHGRPAVKRLTRVDIEKMFGRL